MNKTLGKLQKTPKQPRKTVEKHHQRKTSTAALRSFWSRFPKNTSSQLRAKKRELAWSFGASLPLECLLYFFKYHLVIFLWCLRGDFDVFCPKLDLSEMRDDAPKRKCFVAKKSSCQSKEPLPKPVAKDIPYLNLLQQDPFWVEN